MPIWLQTLIAIAAGALFAPLVVWAAKRFGGRARGGIALAGLMLGLGEVVDPPSKHMVEAGDAEEKEKPTPGDPPTV